VKTEINQSTATNSKNNSSPREILGNLTMMKLLKKGTHS